MNYTGRNVANVDLNIEELMQLIDFCYERANSIPKNRYNDPTAAGTTFGDTAKKYRDRGNELHRLLNTVWPK